MFLSIYVKKILRLSDSIKKKQRQEDGEKVAREDWEEWRNGSSRWNSRVDTEKKKKM